MTEMERIISKSKMTEEDALELGEKISKSIAERFRKHVTEFTECVSIYSRIDDTDCTKDL